MRRTLLALALLFVAIAVPSSSFAQEAVSDSAKIEKLTYHQYNQLKRLVYLESAHGSMKADLEALNASNEKMDAQLQETLERLAQSESAINATLETFQQKFDEQNKTIADVQEVLKTKMQQMLTYIGAGIVAALILMFIVARSAASNAVKSHEANWNAFQEHLFKSK
ncbi:MAG: hypothetical protein ACPGYN_04330 [Schleiferiaceae bacterium]